MLSPADVGVMLTKMQQFDRFIDVTELSVLTWHQLLESVIPDLETAETAMFEAYRTEHGRVTPALIIDIAAEIQQERDQAIADQAENRRLMLEALDKAGVTEPEFLENGRDPVWFKEHFPDESERRDEQGSIGST